MLRTLTHGLPALHRCRGARVAKEVNEVRSVSLRSTRRLECTMLTSSGTKMY